MLVSDAVKWNSHVKNNYGPEKFIVVHTGGIVEQWSALNRQHLERLLRIQKNMGYMISIDEVRREDLPLLIKQK